ncbi:hypothetical protein STEG23_027151, partial [Scotinomys teguina]
MVLPTFKMAIPPVKCLQKRSHKHTLWELTKATGYRKLGELDLFLGPWKAVDTFSLNKVTKPRTLGYSNGKLTNTRAVPTNMCSRPPPSLGLTAQLRHDGSGIQHYASSPPVPLYDNIAYKFFDSL